MSKHITLLSVVLAAQLLLVAVVNLTGEDYETFEAEDLLLSIDTQTVDGIRMEHGTDSVVLDSVVLHRQEGQWRLPERGNSPANPHRVEQLLNSLAGLKKGWPVARTRGAAQRFNVDEKQFEQKLILLSGGHTEVTLYFGSSPGFRKVYVRQGHEDDVFAVEFDTSTTAVKTDDWVDIVEGI